MPDLSLKDKVAIVTGGSGDIGGAIARKLAEQGATTVSYTHLTLPTSDLV